MARQDLKPLTILHVEDDENDAILLHKACERAKLPVVLCRVENADRAKQYLAGDGEFADRVRYPLPQVVVLDLKLPCVSGFDFLQWLRAQPDLVSLPVLVFTSSLSRDDKAQAMANGANWYFVKPSSFEALVQMVGGFGFADMDRLN